MTDEFTAADMAAHDARALAAQYPGQVTVHNDLASFAAAIRAAEVARERAARPLTDKTRRKMARLVQRFYDTVWYGSPAQQRTAAREWVQELREWAPQFMVPAVIVEPGDYVRAVGVNPYDGTPDAVTGVVVESRYTSRDIQTADGVWEQFGQLLTLEVPLPARRESTCHEVFVDEPDRVLRLPRPRRRKRRPAWLDVPQ